MHATEPCFHTLLQGARILEDWGVTADIARYRATSERLRDLAAAKEGIDAALATQRETLDLVAFRLGSARAAERVTAGTDETGRLGIASARVELEA
jgi:hypothetical protein